MDAIEEIKKAKKENATKLDLSHRNLISIPDEVFELTNLTELVLINNQLTEIPDPLARLTGLKKLYLGSNQLTEIPDSFAELTGLKTLYLGSNQLTEIPDSFAKLTGLKKLYLGGNQLTEIPDSFAKLTGLKMLYLGGNQLTKIPDFLTELNDLKKLHLGGNQLTEIPDSFAKLTELTSLDLNNNQIKEIPVNIASTFFDRGIKWQRKPKMTMNGIYIRNNPLKLPPPEIIQNGTKALKDYFHSIEKNKKIINEVKVLLVGEGLAGKTSLLNRLQGKPFDENEKQTTGINIVHKEIKTGDGIVNVHYWDFGGQEIMHATHQFFLSKRSLYVLVIDKRREDKNEYWLKLIESFGGDSPIILVLNKMDENPSFNVNRKNLLEKYKNIKCFFHISCKDDTGMEDLQNKIAEMLTKTSLYGAVWAPEWYEIKEHLEKETKAYIPYEKYIDICKDKNLTDVSTQETLICFLNDLGSIIHFDSPELEHTHVLKPRWITEAVYRIINSEEVAINKGLLKREELKGILKKKYAEDFEYPLDKHDYIINLMNKFEICYPCDDNDVLLPSLLDVEEPEYNFNKEDSLNFIIEYDFMPKSIFPRFMVKIHNSLKTQWRTGLLTEDNHSDASALVMLDDDQKKIYIYVSGKKKRDYFASLLYILRDINDSFEKLEYKELVPMPDNLQITVSYDHLLYLAEKGKNIYEPDGAKKEYQVNELLGHIIYYKEPLDKVLERIEEIHNKIDQNNSESIPEAINKIGMLKPNLYGVGFDFNELFEQIGKKGFSKYLTKIKSTLKERLRIGSNKD